MVCSRWEIGFCVVFLEKKIYGLSDRLLDYDQQFKDGDEASKLDNIKARFQWLRRELQFYAEHFQTTFPASWEMPQLLCEEFCLVTNQKLATILSAARKADSLR